MRARIYELLQASELLTDEVAEAVDVIMDIAVNFDAVPDSPAQAMTQAWSDWTANELFAVLDRKSREAVE